MASDEKATRFNRLQTTSIRDDNPAGRAVAEVPQTHRFVLSATATADNPANKHTIRGEFSIDRIVVTTLTAVNASSKTVNIGIDTTAGAARFAASVIASGANNARTVVAPASATVPAWISTGSAQAVTTVRAYVTDVSGFVNAAYVDVDYVVRSWQG